MNLKKNKKAVMLLLVVTLLAVVGGVAYFGRNQALQDASVSANNSYFPKYPIGYKCKDGYVEKE